VSDIQAPKGTQDIFFPEISLWQFLESKTREFFGRFLYREIRTPMFEHTELFQRGIGGDTEVVQKEMYTFRDKGDRSITLRPENTASVMRAAIEHNLFENHFPLKYYYIGAMFRYDKPQKGRFRQFHQLGVEVLGGDAPEIDAEVIFAAATFLREIGLADSELHINSVGCSSCRPAYLRRLQETVAGCRERLCPDCQRKAASNPLRIFDCKNEACQAVSAAFPVMIDFLCAECRSHFRGVQEALRLLAVDHRMNPRLVRGLDYYTRTAFEIVSPGLGAQNALLGGGRYNDLIKSLGGPDTPGIGFAAGMERIVSQLSAERVPPARLLVIAYQNSGLLPAALRLGRELWQQGFAAYIDYQSANLKKQFKKADRLGAAWTLILGEEEVAAGTVSAKDMSSQEQVAVPRASLAAFLRERL